MYQIVTTFKAKNTTGKIFIAIFFFYSCYGHLLHHICNIAGFAGTKLRVESGDFSQEEDLTVCRGIFQNEKCHIST